MYPAMEAALEDKSGSKVMSDSDTSFSGSLLKQVETDETIKKSFEDS